MAVKTQAIGAASSLLCRFCGCIMIFPCSAAWEVDRCPNGKKVGGQIMAAGAAISPSEGKDEVLGNDE